MSAFERVGRIFMAEVFGSKTSPAWREVLDADDKTSDDWFDDLMPFIPLDVKTVFGHGRPPTLTELRSLSLHPHDKGVYCDILKPKTSLDLSPHIYVGATIQRDVALRIANHSSPLVLEDQPNSKYYQLKHGTSDYQGRFVSFAVIRIDGRLDDVEISHRRALCRLTEALFTLWTKAIDTTHTRAIDLLVPVEIAFTEAYGEQDVEWLGLNTHSPLKEQVGVADHGTVAKGRYEALMEGYAEVFGGKENIPDQWETKAKKRSMFDADTQRQTRVERTEREKDIPDFWVDQYAGKKRKWASETPEEQEQRVEDTSEYHKTYQQNMFAAMTPNDRKDFKKNAARKTRKSNVKRALELGILTQANYDAAEKKDWKTQPGFPNAWIKKLEETKKD